MRKAFATTPVAEIVAHSGDGFVDKGAEASAMAKRLIVCCDGTWNTLNQAVCGDPCPTNVSQMAGRSRTSLGGTQQRWFYEGGSASTGGSDPGAERSASASTRYVTPTLPRPQLRAGR
jgi:uncharacterized protein (DUF2235 family)